MSYHIVAPLYESVLGKRLGFHDAAVVGIIYRYERGRILMELDFERFDKPLLGGRERYYRHVLAFEGATADRPFELLGEEIYSDKIEERNGRIEVEFTTLPNGGVVSFRCVGIRELELRETAGTIRR